MKTLIAASLKFWGGKMAFDPIEFRKSFSQLNEKIDGRPLIYFDSAASTLKHNEVCERINLYNKYEVANVHRGAHSLSQKGTENYEWARQKVARFIGASDDNEVIFTRGTTESINLVAATFVADQLKAGDEILISSLEHHSNIVPWQILAEKTGIQIKVVELDRGEGFSFAKFLNRLNDRTRFVSMLWYSNSLGCRLPVEKIVEECKKRDIPILIDAAQAPLTEKINLKELDCDFLCFSGHKMYGPYGIGILYGKAAHLRQMPPYQGGGSMIDRVSFAKTTFADIPQKFEAGTPNVSGAIGLGKAVEVIEALDFSGAHKHVMNLRTNLIQELKAIPGYTIYDFPSAKLAGVVSFNFQGAHPSDIGTLMDQYGIAVRAGHHCTQPLMDELGVSGTVRVSLAPYNLDQEVEEFLKVATRMGEFF